MENKNGPEELVAVTIGLRLRLDHDVDTEYVTLWYSTVRYGWHHKLLPVTNLTIQMVLSLTTYYVVTS